MGYTQDHRAAADEYAHASGYAGAKPYHRTAGQSPEDAAHELSRGHEQVQYEDCDCSDGMD